MAILEDSYWPAGSITSALTIGGTWSKAAQSITTGGDEDYDITSIGLCLKPTAAGCGTVHVELYAADGDGFPAGAVLSSGTVAEDDINVQTIPAPPAETVIAMGSYTINKNTAYVIVMYPDEIGGGPPAHGISMCGVGSNAYGYGHPSVYVTASSSWLSKPTYEAAFKVYGNPVSEGDPPNKPTTPSPADGATGQRLNLASFSWSAG